MDAHLISSRIYELRGQKVMFDFDLAELYAIETKVLKQAVKRNISRFPSDFMYEIDNHEFRNLRSQIVTSSWGGNRRSSYVFTEHGVAMLASVLRSDQAIQMNIEIIRAFILMRRVIIEVSELSDQIKLLKAKISDHNVQLNEIYTALENLLDQKIELKNWDERDRIGFRS